MSNIAEFIKTLQDAYGPRVTLKIALKKKVLEFLCLLYERTSKLRIHCLWTKSLQRNHVITISAYRLLLDLIFTHIFFFLCNKMSS